MAMACPLTLRSFWNSAVSGLALGVSYSLDQVVAALVGRDLAGQALLHLDVELIGPGEMPWLVERGHDGADVSRLVPHLEDRIDVAPRRPSGPDGVALHHRIVPGAEHRILGEVDGLRVRAVLGPAAE